VTRGDQPGLPAGERDRVEERFDRATAKRILRRAAEADARMDAEEADSFTLEQLQAIGTEAGISPEAIRAAAREQGAVADERGGWLAALRRRLPASWSPRLKNAFLIGAGAALVALITTIAGVGPIVVAVSAAVLVLILLLVLLGLGPV
jgi:hypothetical protein